MSVRVAQPVLAGVGNDMTADGDAGRAKPGGGGLVGNLTRRL